MDLYSLYTASFFPMLQEEWTGRRELRPVVRLGERRLVARNPEDLENILLKDL